MHGKTRLLLSLVACVGVSHTLTAADTTAAHGNLTLAQIVEKHEAARGGSVWRNVQTLAVAGKMDAGAGDSVSRSVRAAGGASVTGSKKDHADAAASAAKGSEESHVQLPFRLELKPPHKSRLEIDFAGKTAVQVYDGTNGWKLRPYLNRNDVEPFTPEESKTADTAIADMKGSLIDYAASGTQALLEGTEAVEGHDAYKIKLTKANGDVRHVWIDAQSFLDVKVEGAPRRMDGRMRHVWIVQRDFRAVQGLKLPFVYETLVEGGAQPHKMTIETATVNRPLDDSRFAKPQAPVGAPPKPISGAASAPPIKTKPN